MCAAVVTPRRLINGGSGVVDAVVREEAPVHGASRAIVSVSTVFIATRHTFHNDVDVAIPVR
jgi:hypothetical protein